MDGLDLSRLPDDARELLRKAAIRFGRSGESLVEEAIMLEYGDGALAGDVISELFRPEGDVRG